MYFEVNGLKTFCSNGSGNLLRDQPAVVFLHGAGLDHSNWVLPARHFARRKFNVFALDLPGHGRSAGSALDSIPSMSEWLRDAVAALDLSQPAVVGHSMGSLVALHFAARYPDSLRVLALLGTSLPMPVSDPLLDAARANHHDAIDMANIWSHSSIGQIGGNETPGIHMLMSGQRLLEKAGPDVFFTDLNACNEFTEAVSLAKKVAVESLVIVGDQDKMTAPVNAVEVANNIERCAIRKLSPCGHAMLAEQPNAVLDALITIV